MMDITDSLKNITVSTIMTPNVITVNEKQTLREASKFMYQHNIGGLIVLMDTSNNENAEIDKPIGIITERDIARLVAFSSNLSTDTVISEVMSKPLITINQNSSIKEVTDLMQKNDIRRLPIVDNKGKLVGIITAKDILRSLMEFLKSLMSQQDLMQLAF
ncbi:MAG TPA: CBS domain-containing protein [Nitrososphaeraceae archaeon]|jgi:CBS domain-containing protein|nr:CBS domain-containing protein [Nitrososphaeraceae archaeon]